MLVTRCCVGFVVLVGAAAAAGCTGPQSTAPAASASATTAAPAAVDASASASASASVAEDADASGVGVGKLEARPSWKKVSLVEAAVAVDMIEAAPVEHVTWDGGGGTVFQAATNASSSVHISVRAEKEEGIDGFRNDHNPSSWKYKANAKTTVCNGKAATLVSASRGSQQIACVIAAGGENHPQYIPATTANAVVFEHRKLPIRVTWEVESDDPSFAGEIQKRVISSIRCE